MYVRVDRFAYFAGFVELKGSIPEPAWPVRAVALQVDGAVVARARVVRQPTDSFPAALDFHIRALTDIQPERFRAVTLKLIGALGKSLVVDNIGANEVHGASGHRLFRTFLDRLAATPHGHVLEIGSRARSGIVRRDLVPPAWDYTGIDILAGENVDVVGDAHAMSTLLPVGRFNAAMSLSVFEHLAMPWKVAVELGKVMAIGGLAFIQTHQTFPVHDAPWDFWRVSKEAWPSLFNRHTGFRIVEVGEAEPAFVVPTRWHPGVNHADAPGWSLTAVIAEKIGEPTVDWPVPLADLVEQQYPG